MRISSSIAAARALLLTLALGAPGLQALDRQTKIAQFVHTAWTGNQIPFREVWNLAQTPDGYLWISSADGVFRFDGIRFTRFEPPSGEAIPRSVARQLLATRDGSVWMVFLSGEVSRVRDGHVTTFSLQELPRTNWLTEDRDGSIVAATARPGLARFRDGRWQKIADSLHYSAKYTFYVFFDRDGALWVRTEDRLLRLPPNEKYFTDPGAKLDSPIDRYIPAKSPDLQQAPFAQAPDGTIWFAQSRVSAHTVWPGNRPATEVKFSYSSLAQFDREGALWLGSGDAGLRRVRFPEQIAGKSIADSSPEVEHFTRKDGLSGDFVISSLLDREGNLWFGTDAGLDRFRDGAFRRLVLPHPERVSDVLPLQPKGLLITSTSERLLQRVNPDDTVTVLPQATPFSGACQDQDGTVWVANPNGISWLIGDRVSPPVLPQFRAAQSMLCAGGAVWFMERNVAFLRFANGKVEVVRGVLPVVRTAYLESNEALWGSYPDGRVFRFETGKYREFGTQDGLPAGQVNEIARDRDGRLWFAGNAGLATFDNGRFKHVDVLPGEMIQAIDFDDAGFLWLSAGGKILRMDPREYDRAVANPPYRPVAVVYDASDGVDGRVHLIRIANDGRIFAITESGLAFADPRHLPKNPIPPPVSVEKLLAGGKEMSAASNLSLPPGTRNLEIDYTALSLTIPERVRFRYKLEGADKGWQEAGTRRQAFYNNLSPRNYRFLVRACNNDGVWNEAGAAWSFSILPAFYETWWFQSLYVLAGAGILWLLVQLRLRQIAARLNVRMEERVDERLRVARDLHDTLLQTIQGSKIVAEDALDEDADPIRMRRALESVVEWLGRAVEEGRSALNSLRGSTMKENALAEAFRRAGEECRFQRSIEFDLSVENTGQEMHPIVRDEVYRIGYEAIRNACVHSGASRLTVELSYAESMTLRVKDNGKGIDPNVAANGKIGHFGLIGMYERASRIRGKLTLSSSPGLGTEVKLVVPRKIAFLTLAPVRPNWYTKIRRAFGGGDRSHLAARRKSR